MMNNENAATHDRDLRDLLGLSVPPIAIAFVDSVPAGLPRPGGAMPSPTPDGRTGAAPAGCVFWMTATEHAFATVAADHGNCSVGSYTHGFKTLAEAASGADVAAFVGAEWVTMADAATIPTVAKKPQAVLYGPLAAAAFDPDIVFLRLTGKQLMLVKDAWPELHFEGKPQCHIIPIAQETGAVAVSSGCMLSRVRTGMPNTEVTCALPAAKLGDLIARLKRAQAADMKVAAYAAADAKRFQGAPA
ncbi:MAG TPA: DUF169 domain-containing protein [Stellaceae bacterium]|nr:DUF169 domain-containing protein [Stellaceae bacterium]